MAAIVADALNEWLDDRERNLKELREALVEGENSGEPRSFDSESFLTEMRNKYVDSA